MEALLLPIHITTAFCLVCLVIYTDHQGVSWLRGKRAVLSFHTLEILHYLVWTGLLIMLASGITMFSIYREYLLTVPAFYFKMFFVAALVTNAFFIGKLMRIATERSFASLSQKKRLPLFVSGAISTISWIGVITCAFMLGI